MDPSQISGAHFCSRPGSMDVKTVKWVFGEFLFAEGGLLKPRNRRGAVFIFDPSLHLDSRSRFIGRDLTPVSGGARRSAYEPVG